jgi:hypothetical protein
MLSIKHVHKRLRLFLIELGLFTVACLGILLMALRILKYPFASNTDAGLTSAAH